MSVAADAAEQLLRTLITALGADVVRTALTTLVGDGVLSGDLLIFAAAILRIVLEQVGPARAQAILEAEYAAADAAADGAEKAKFGS